MKEKKHSEFALDQLNDFKKIYSMGWRVFFDGRRDYGWDEIVSGKKIENRGAMFAVAPNTFRGFTRKNKGENGAMHKFVGYFMKNKQSLVGEMKKVESEEALDDLSDRVCSEIKASLDNVMPDRVESYNAMRRPVDLYFEHLVAMSNELQSERNKLSALLFLPLDRPIFESELVFSKAELKCLGVTRAMNARSISSKEQYMKMQRFLRGKSEKIGLLLKEIDEEYKRGFHRIFFDLIWGERFNSDGGNLFLVS